MTSAMTTKVLVEQAHRRVPRTRVLRMAALTTKVQAMTVSMTTFTFKIFPFHALARGIATGNVSNNQSGSLLQRMILRHLRHLHLPHTSRHVQNTKL
jgi:hypothetical protein